MIKGFIISKNFFSVSVTMSSISVVTLFSCCLLVTYGNFHSIATIVAFYVIFLIMAVFNIVFNERIIHPSQKYAIGETANVKESSYIIHT